MTQPARPTQAIALDSRRSRSETGALLAVARAGLAGPTHPFPHASRIDASFGRYAPQGLRAHLDAAAAAANHALHAHAYVLGNRAAFSGPPSLRLAAHEAAHVAAQAHGLAPAGSIGVLGDAGERLADRVADRVAAGGSAEPLLAAALGASRVETPAAPALQMLNRLDPATTKKAFDTPWKEIADQLGIPAVKLRSKMQIQNAAFGTMVDVLKNNCMRAEKAVATIDGHRPGGAARKNDQTQTAYGTLGRFIEFITGTSILGKKYDFEGGHLVSDEILGDNSYVQENFAPQRRLINSPAYRKIEEIAARGVSQVGNIGTPLVAPERTMTVTLTYQPGKLKIPAKDVIARLGLSGSTDVTNHPADVKLEQRVPSKWHAVVDTGSDNFAFAHETTVDSKGTSGAAIGFVPTEHDIDLLHADAAKYIDTNAWAMDSMANFVYGQTSSTLGTGSGKSRRRAHSFSAVQAVPTGSNLTKGTALPTAAPPKPPAPYVLKKAHSFSELVPSTLGARGNHKKRRRSLAKTIKQENPGWQPAIVDLEVALGRMEAAMHASQKGRKVTLDDELKKLASGPKHKKQRLAEVGDVLFNQFDDTNSTSPF